MSGRGRFKSYLNQYEVEMKEKGKATFKSYVDDESKTEEGNEEEEFEEVEKSANDFFEGFPDPGNLFKGERVIAHADKVLKFAPYSDRKQGLSGHMFVTNFKIAFMTADRSSYEEPDKKQERSQLIGEHDIPLTKVDSIYQVISGGKKKKLLPGNSVSNLTKYLEIHCKDLQIHTFGFKFCPKEHKKTVTNAIVHHAHPTRADLLFAYDYGHHSKFPENRLKMPLFFEKQDWEQELNRLHCFSDWRVTEVNREFNISMSLPEYFVVPMRLLNADLNKAASQFIDNRFPVWSYTHTNRASIVRMSQICPESEFKEYENKILSAVKQSLPESSKDLEVIDLSKQCPSIHDLQLSFEKLKDICMSDCVKDFINQEMTWYSSLEASQWLLNISRCFHCVIDVVNTVSNKRQTVVLKEESGCDMCCVVTCLSQLCLDPHCRTQVGFQSLVQREWVVMGHPFHTRLGLSLDCEGEQAPVFLFFLDCVWQFLQQFPSSFAFTETYLTTLWDSVHLGLFETFLFNNSHQRRKFMMEGRRLRRVNLPSVWDWKIQFSDVDLTLFNNPLYVMKGQYNFNNIVKSAKETLRQTGEVLRNDLYKMKLAHLYNEDDHLFQDLDAVLVPQDTILFIKLWTQCFLRWNVPAQIVGGGNPSQYLQQCLLAEEVIHLQHKLKVLQTDSFRKRCVRPKSDLIFSCGEEKNSAVYENCFLTSSFPFSSGTGIKNHQAILVTPITCYLENSTITSDYGYEDD